MITSFELVKKPNHTNQWQLCREEFSCTAHGRCWLCKQTQYRLRWPSLHLLAQMLDVVWVEWSDASFLPGGQWVRLASVLIGDDASALIGDIG
jgi:hypothetical protein